MQIQLKHSESEANKFHFDLINYKEFNKSQSFKVVADLSEIQNELKSEIEKNEGLTKKLALSEKLNQKLQNSIKSLEEERLLLDSSLKARQNQNEKTKAALGDQIKFSNELENKVEIHFKKMVERWKKYFFH